MGTTALLPREAGGTHVHSMGSRREPVETGANSVGGGKNPRCFRLSLLQPSSQPQRLWVDFPVPVHVPSGSGGPA